MHCIVFVVNQKRIPTAADIDYGEVLNYIHPFIITEGTETSTIRLVHQSLRELILERRPQEWMSNDLIRSKVLQRKNQLHEKFGSLCVKYLSLPSISEKELLDKALFSRFHDLDGKDLHDDWMQSIVPFDEDSLNDESQNGVQQKTQSFDPYREGFGGFFSYASCCWPQHIKNCQDEIVINVEDGLCISRAGSVALKNWSEQYRRPSCSHVLERDLPSFEILDPLVIATFFGLKSLSIATLEQQTSKPTYFTNTSAFDSASIALTNCDVFLTKHILERTCDSSLRKWMQDWKFLMRIVLLADQKGWDEVLIMIIARMGKLVLDWAPAILCEAISESGRLGLIQKLFEIGSKRREFGHAMLEDRWRERKHQSVGIAAFLGYGDILAFLCRQKGIEGHLRHRGPENGTVFHAAAETISSHPQAPALFEPLIDRYPEGIDLEDDFTTPLHSLVIKGSKSSVYRLEAAKILLKTGKVNVNFRTDTGATSLHSAVLKADSEMICLLVRAGANPKQFFGLDSNGQLYIKVKLAFETDGRQLVMELSRNRDFVSYFLL